MTSNSLQHFANQTAMWPDTGKPMPVLFVGHGAPTYALGDNEYSSQWKKLAEQLPRPKAIVCISAHWLTRGTYVTGMEQPRTIYDFGRFDDRLFELEYPAPGAPELAELIASEVTQTPVELDHRWGLDHGTWCVLIQMYPEANIPVLQFSIDYDKPGDYHYQLARDLRFLRKKGVLVICSGNIVHNLRKLSFGNEKAYDWAEEFDAQVVDLIDAREHRALIHYESLGEAALLSVPTPDHYYPLLYALGMQESNDDTSYPVVGMAYRSTSMRSVLIGEH